jgi:hypothetical protein
MQSGAAKTKEWVLEYEPEQPRQIEPLPAMAAGVSKRLWEIGNIMDVLEAWEQSQTEVARHDTQETR